MRRYQVDPRKAQHKHWTAALSTWTSEGAWKHEHVKHVCFGMSRYLPCAMYTGKVYPHTGLSGGVAGPTRCYRRHQWSTRRR